MTRNGLCAICETLSTENLAAVERLLAEGCNVTALARSLSLPQQSLQRHKVLHLNPRLLAEVKRRKEAGDASLLDNVLRRIEEIDENLIMLNEVSLLAGDLRSALLCDRERLRAADMLMNWSAGQTLTPTNAQTVEIVMAQLPANVREAVRALAAQPQPQTRAVEPFDDADDDGELDD
jgi:hypothetical protein